MYAVHQKYFIFHSISWLNWLFLAHIAQFCTVKWLLGVKSFAPAWGSPVSQASGLILVLLDKDYPSQHPSKPCARTYNIRERGNEQAGGVFENRDLVSILFLVFSYILLKKYLNYL